ncbi:hypothetical protein QE428_000784 [Microbacterium sp. SORGH_AS 505]|nr:hypothetical protein [Microbacterium sp. SORGH_AS_0505]
MRRFAKRTPSRLSTVERPRKWSTRKTWPSGTSSASVAFRCSALAASNPNGFSSARIVPSGIVTERSASQAFAATAGGTAK